MLHRKADSRYLGPINSFADRLVEAMPEIVAGLEHGLETAPLWGPRFEDWRIRNGATEQAVRTVLADLANVSARLAEDESDAENVILAVDAVLSAGAAARALADPDAARWINCYRGFWQIDSVAEWIGRLVIAADCYAIGVAHSEPRPLRPFRP
jgi:hypothetical protein